jgi:hypothetical protein
METPYQTLKRRGVRIVELPVTLRPDASVCSEIYVAEVPAGVRIGVLHEHGDTSFVIPKNVLSKLLEVLSTFG